jgi:uncharacterized protein (DUF305 family)
MTRFHLSTLVAFLVACNTEADRADVPSVVDMPATGPGPAEVAANLPPEKVEEGTERMPFDHSFLNAMIEHHKAGEDAAKLALERAQHPELKAMAQEMITADLAHIEKMKELRRQWYGTAGAPTALLPKDEKSELPGTETTKAMAKDLDELKKAEPFDLAFIDAMIPHHQGAIDMATAAGDKAQQPETKALASIIVRDESRAIDQMKTWRQAWYPTAQATTQGTPSTDEAAPAAPQ